MTIASETATDLLLAAEAIPSGPEASLVQFITAAGWREFESWCVTLRGTFVGGIGNPLLENNSRMLTFVCHLSSAAFHTSPDSDHRGTATQSTRQEQRMMMAMVGFLKRLR